MQRSALVAKTKAQRNTQDQFSRVTPSVTIAAVAGGKRDPRANWPEPGVHGLLEVKGRFDPS